MSSLLVALQVTVQLLWQRILSVAQWLLQNLTSGMAVIGRRWTGVGGFEIAGPEEGEALGAIATGGGCLPTAIVVLVIILVIGTVRNWCRFSAKY
jgi:integral membrane sensor domain MASE1